MVVCIVTGCEYSQGLCGQSRDHLGRLNLFLTLLHVVRPGVIADRAAMLDMSLPVWRLFGRCLCGVSLVGAFVAPGLSMPLWRLRFFL